MPIQIAAAPSLGQFLAGSPRPARLRSLRSGLFIFLESEEFGRYTGKPVMKLLAGACPHRPKSIMKFRAGVIWSHGKGLLGHFGILMSEVYTVLSRVSILEFQTSILPSLTVFVNFINVVYFTLTRKYDRLPYSVAKNAKLKV